MCSHFGCFGNWLVFMSGCSVPQSQVNMWSNFVMFWHCQTKRPLDKLDLDFWPSGLLNGHLTSLTMVISIYLWSCRACIPLYFVEWNPKRSVALFKVDCCFFPGEKGSMFSSGGWVDYFWRDSIWYIHFQNGISSLSSLPPFKFHKQFYVLIFNCTLLYSLYEGNGWFQNVMHKQTNCNSILWTSNDQW